MASIKESVGTPIAEVDGLGEEDRRRLAAVSVTTAEELVGLITADPHGTERLLSVDDITRLGSEAGFVASRSSTPSLDEAPDETFRTGAAAPEYVQAIEVQPSEVERRAAAPDLFAAAGEPGTGKRFLDCFSPIRYQGGRSTCVAHAVCALAECLERREGSDTDLSEQYVYWDAKQHDGQVEDEGTLITVAMDRMTADGACLEATWPYVPDMIAGNESQAPPPGAAAPDASGHRLVSSDDLGRHDAAAIRAALDAQRPVALSVPVFPNWVGNPMLKLSGFIPMPLPGSGNDGGHAMCAAGYDFDAEFTGGGYFVLRNSWGEGFAPRSPIAAGHALLPFAYWEEYGWEAFAGAR
jgi:hypothetical protein